AEEVVRVCERWLIHHGVAEENDFPDSNTEGSDLFSKSDLNSTPLFSLAQYGNVTGIADDATVESVKTPRKPGPNDVDLTARGQVNLFGSQESSVAESIFTGSNVSTAPNDSNFHEEFLLSRTSSIHRVKQKEHDVLDMAMQELSTTGSQLPPPEKKSNTTETAKSQPDKQVPDETNVSTNEVDSMIQEVRRTLRWYRQVPVWFWAVFAAGYILATFLAGILFALLLNLNAHR
ncbi:MAG: hypothetical protein Q4G59_10800, partial [Planctomycetia bacterium]|nr:hypothetical protein [Planctomycetia bacterium]